ncbi:MAG: hypothetical protein GTO29_11265 [Candidatus Latescibacteria bacterium]|nr:hypothetical protein [Candidatus Latescibacterota bacterium]NIO56743.1 hypothetical protein [Candidatus Latescibacterota bacterium]NIT02328.1 hypothetical protein [Candidatus Latescibacterota bacterium]NIT39211.1 hypothetical protein [Candidatus Latescibacterota bacterium]
MRVFDGITMFWLPLVLALISGIAACDQRPLDLAPETPSLEWHTIEKFSYRAMLTDVWCSSGNDVYVGYRYGLLYHFDGVDWEEILLEGHETLYIFDIWGSGPNDVYVADGKLHHFDGTSWSELPIAAVVVGGTAADDVYAADSRYVYHFNGVVWDILHDFNEHKSPKAIWAGPGPSLVLVRLYDIVHWDGATWRGSDPSGRFWDIWGISPNDLYVVGQILGVPTEDPIILHYDGSDWSPMPVPEMSDNLYGVWGASFNDVYAVGYRGTILHYDGFSWSLAEPVTASSLFGIYGSGPSDIYAVGENKKILHFDGSNWTSAWEDKPVCIEAAWAESISRIAGYCRKRSIYIYDNNQWRESFAVKQYERVEAFGGTSLDNLYASLSTGSIIHFDGTIWSLSADSLSGRQLAFWAASQNDIFSVGTGSIYHYDGTGWNAMMEGEPFRLHSVWGSSSDNVIAVGDGGKILRYNGTSWSGMNSGITQALYDVWGTSKNDVFAVGQAGILHYDGIEWSSQPGYRSSDLRMIAGRAPNDVIAIGYGGLLLHFNGLIWNHQEINEHPVDILNALDGSLILVSSNRISYLVE